MFDVGRHGSRPLRRLGLALAENFTGTLGASFHGSSSVND